MVGAVDARLKELKIELPRPPAPVANYVPFVQSGNLIYLSGQIPLQDGKVKVVGTLGKDLSIEQGREAARLCALNLLGHLRNACGGDLDRVVRCIKIGGYVASTPDFGDHPKVINGASDLIVEVLGDKGRHARFAVGAGTLPLGAAVEVDAVFEVA
ncbi:MAG: RidA family protein [Alphaproteobacteria bacterium]|nr:RidA family protein [Alphaproteobacteria bacterium]